MIFNPVLVFAVDMPPSNAGDEEDKNKEEPKNDDPESGDGGQNNEPNDGLEAGDGSQGNDCDIKDVLACSNVNQQISNDDEGDSDKDSDSDNESNDDDDDNNSNNNKKKDDSKTVNVESILDVESVVNTPDGTVVVTYKNGTIIITSPSGNSIEMHPSAIKVDVEKNIFNATDKTTKQIVQDPICLNQATWSATDDTVPLGVGGDADSSATQQICGIGNEDLE